MRQLLLDGIVKVKFSLARGVFWDRRTLLEFDNRLQIFVQSLRRLILIFRNGKLRFGIGYNLLGLFILIKFCNWLGGYDILLNWGLLLGLLNRNYFLVLGLGNRRWLDLLLFLHRWLLICWVNRFNDRSSNRF